MKSRFKKEIQQHISAWKEKLALEAPVFPDFLKQIKPISNATQSDNNNIPLSEPEKSIPRVFEKLNPDSQQMRDATSQILLNIKENNWVYPSPQPSLYRDIGSALKVGGQSYCNQERENLEGYDFDEDDAKSNDPKKEFISQYLFKAEDPKSFIIPHQFFSRSEAMSVNNAYHQKLYALLDNSTDYFATTYQDNFKKLPDTISTVLKYKFTNNLILENNHYYLDVIQGEFELRENLPELISAPQQIRGTLQYRYIYSNEGFKLCWIKPSNSFLEIAAMVDPSKMPENFFNIIAQAKEEEEQQFKFYLSQQTQQTQEVWEAIHNLLNSDAQDTTPPSPATFQRLDDTSARFSTNLKNYNQGKTQDLKQKAAISKLKRDASFVETFAAIVNKSRPIRNAILFETIVRDFTTQIFQTPFYSTLIAHYYELLDSCEPLLDSEIKTNLLILMKALVHQCQSKSLQDIESYLARNDIPALYQAISKLSDTPQQNLLEKLCSIILLEKDPKVLRKHYEAILTLSSEHRDFAFSTLFKSLSYDSTSYNPDYFHEANWRVIAELSPANHVVMFSALFNSGLPLEAFYRTILSLENLNVSQTLFNSLLHYIYSNKNSSILNAHHEAILNLPEIDQEAFIKKLFHVPEKDEGTIANITNYLQNVVNLSDNQSEIKNSLMVSFFRQFNLLMRSPLYETPLTLFYSAITQFDRPTQQFLLNQLKLHLTKIIRPEILWRSTLVLINSKEDKDDLTALAGTESVRSEHLKSLILWYESNGVNFDLALKHCTDKKILREIAFIRTFGKEGQTLKDSFLGKPAIKDGKFNLVEAIVYYILFGWALFPIKNAFKYIAEYLPYKLETIFHVNFVKASNQFKELNNINNKSIIVALKQIGYGTLIPLTLSGYWLAKTVKTLIRTITSPQRSARIAFQTGQRIYPGLGFVLVGISILMSAAAWITIFTLFPLLLLKLPAVLSGPLAAGLSQIAQAFSLSSISVGSLTIKTVAVGGIILGMVTVGVSFLLKGAAKLTELWPVGNGVNKEELGKEGVNELIGQKTPGENNIPIKKSHMSISGMLLNESYKKNHEDRIKKSSSKENGPLVSKGKAEANSPPQGKKINPSELILSTKNSLSSLLDTHGIHQSSKVLPARESKRPQIAQPNSKTVTKQS
ncbi:MAG: hypothetical protein H0W64_06420 [Gammaproteobacteria bacterium]|nr:hypothetical protein [Gammaproteobacteria bacterium]